MKQSSMRKGWMVAGVVGAMFCGTWGTMVARANPQPAILGTVAASGKAIILPDGAQPSTQKIANLPEGVRAHGVAYFGSDFAMISDFGNARLFVVKISTGELLATINTDGAGYDGTGTVAVAPSLKYALAMGSTNTLHVIQAPFSSSSAISNVTLPGSIQGYQTQAIVFNNAGRAFVYTTAGISVLDAPYTSVAFTIPVVNSSSGALGITPDGNTLLTTDFSANISVFRAPYSATSQAQVISVPVSGGLDGIMVTPDGTRALAVGLIQPIVVSVSAPFSASSNFDVISLNSLVSGGFEDVGISADSKLAILTGNGSQAPAVLLRAPFTTAGVKASTFPINNTSSPNRGNGAVRFQPPGLAPGLTLSARAPESVESGANLTYVVDYANTGADAVNNVKISVPVPAGTTFVSASNGGKLVGNNIVFTLGNIAGNTRTMNLTFVVRVTGTSGNINLTDYTIAGDGVAPVAGPPAATQIVAPPSTKNQVVGAGTVFGNGNGIEGGRNLTLKFSLSAAKGTQVTGSVVVTKGSTYIIRSTSITDVVVQGNVAVIKGTATYSKRAGSFNFVLRVTDSSSGKGTFEAQTSWGYIYSGILQQGYIKVG